MEKLIDFSIYFCIILSISFIVLTMFYTRGKIKAVKAGYNTVVIQKQNDSVPIETTKLFIPTYYSCHNKIIKFLEEIKKSDLNSTELNTHAIEYSENVKQMITDNKLNSRVEAIIRNIGAKIQVNLDLKKDVDVLTLCALGTQPHFFLAPNAIRFGDEGKKVEINLLDIQRNAFIREKKVE